MRRWGQIAAALVLTCASASAQSPLNDSSHETVIVTAPKFHAGVTPDAVAHDFVKSFAAPTVLRDAIARWRIAICPRFEGLPPQFLAVMEARFRTIAAQAGAKLADKGCRKNLSVTFTPQPQAYLDALHARSVESLGYKGATSVTHPVQAWYVTGITDLHGQTWRDEESWGLIQGSNYTAFNGPVTQVGGWAFHPDATSDLLAVTILIDTDKASHYMLSEMADYVAMLALSRTEDYDDCQLMPSITNLLTSNCDNKLKPSQITASDIAYLRGVYKMDAGAGLQVQQDQIAAEMAKSIPAPAQ